MYYRYVRAIVQGVAADANSIIDIGSHDTPIIEWFDWVPKRATLDWKIPYTSEHVEGIKTDFFEFNPEEKYDVALCLQVLEHIPDAEAFALKLFDIAQAVVISIPYNWRAGSCKSHIHDPVDMDKLASWTHRNPDYHVIVKEPLSTATRLIAYYHPVNKEFSLADAHKNIL